MPADAGTAPRAPASRPATPVSEMRTFWGLMTAYWVSDRWKEAWFLTVVIILFTAAASKAGVWIAVASAELVTSIAFFHDPRTLEPMDTLISSALALVGLVLLKDAGFVGFRHLVSTTLHRKWRAWLDSRFNAALLDGNHTHFHVQSGAGALPGGSPLDNIDQRVQDSIKGMTGGAIGLAMGVIGVLTSLFFVGQKLLETSTEVEGLAFLGAYGTAVLALAAVTAYVPLNTFIALRIGKVLQGLNAAIQQTEGTYRGELTMLLRRSFQVAAARGEDVQRRLHARLYKGIDRTWERLNRFDAGYMSFTLVYNFFAARIVAYAPGFVPYVRGNISLQSYVTGAELVNQLIAECSWFIHVMPAIASLRANARRVTDLADAIETVRFPTDFYAASGRSEFTFSTQNPSFGLTVANLELSHQGADAAVFLRAPALRFRPGSWTLIAGQSGGGKTSLLKAVNGLWPYGRGMIVLPEGVSTMYAAQEIKLPRLSLKQLVCLPAGDDDFEDIEAAAALHKAGLGAFIDNLRDELRDGMPWDQLLSGGQKQLLVLARLLLHRPGLLFLDEATSALDPAARIAFHQALRTHVPGVTVLSVMHDAERPRAADGTEFYDQLVSIEGGVAEETSIAPEREEVPAVAVAAESVAMRVPGRGVARLLRNVRRAN